MKINSSQSAFVRFTLLSSLLLLFSLSCSNNMDSISDNIDTTSISACDGIVNIVDFDSVREGVKRAFFIAHDFRMEQNHSLEEIQTIMTNYMVLEGMSFADAHAVMDEFRDIQNSSSSLLLDSDLSAKIENDIIEFSSFANLNGPTLEESRGFWESKRSSDQLNLISCERSQQLFEILTYSIEGFLEFYYAINSPLDNSRSCDGFWDVR